MLTSLEPLLAICSPRRHSRSGLCLPVVQYSDQLLAISDVFCWNQLRSNHVHGPSIQYDLSLPEEEEGNRICGPLVLINTMKFQSFLELSMQRQPKVAIQDCRLCLLQRPSLILPHNIEKLSTY